MKFKIFAVFLLVIVCFTFIVPFASAVVIEDDSVTWDFHRFYSYWATPTVGSSYYQLVTDDYFYLTSASSDNNYGVLPLPYVFDVRLNGSPTLTVENVKSGFRLVDSLSNRTSLSWNSSDGKLHSYLLILTSTGYFDDVEEMFLFNGLPLFDYGASYTELINTFSEGDGYYISGLFNGNGEAPSFSLSSFLNTTEEWPRYQYYYAMSWYGSPYEYSELTPSYSYNSGVYIGLFCEMTSTSLSYEVGYEEGLNAGKEQANNTVNTGSASYTAGFDTGFDTGYDTGLEQGLQIGYDVGYDEGLDYAYEHVNESSASYIQGKYDGVESANKYTFLGLISAIIDAPIRAIFGYTTVENGVEIQHGGLLTFEVFGQDMSNFVLSIFSIAVVLCIIRIIRGG